MSSAESAEEALAALRDLHDEVDAEANALVAVHTGRLQCRRGCSACCLDELTVTRIEAERIRRGHPDLLRNGMPHAVGACDDFPGFIVEAEFGEHPMGTECSGRSDAPKASTGRA